MWLFTKLIIFFQSKRMIFSEAIKIIAFNNLSQAGVFKQRHYFSRAHSTFIVRIIYFLSCAILANFVAAGVAIDWRLHNDITF